MNNCVVNNNTHSAETQRKKYISKETIDKINNLSPDTLLSHGVLNLVGNKTDEYVCPLCNNGGNGNRDATGIKPKIYPDHVGWKCHRCGESFNNMKIFATYYNMNPQADFAQLCERICSEFNLSVEYDAPLFSSTSEKKSEVNPAELNEINKDLSSDVQPLREFVNQCGGLWRGLPIEILEKFGCRFIKNWTSPKSRAAQKFATPSPRMIIPADRAGLTANYLARLTCSLDDFDENIRKYLKEKPHAGKKTLFNADVLKKPEALKEPIFAVEGYIDAMSIKQAGFSAVAVGGADGYQLLVDAVKILDQKPKIIILFDPDDTGRKHAAILQHELNKIGCPCVIRFLSATNSKLDANQILVEDGVDFLLNKLFAIQQDTQAEFDTVEEKILADAQKTDADVFNGEEYLYGDCSDLDNARRLENFRGKNIRWLTDDEMWLTFSNGIWERRSDKSSCLYSVAVEFGDYMTPVMREKYKEYKALAKLSVEEDKDGFIQRINEEASKKADEVKAKADFACSIVKYFKKRTNYSAAIELLKGLTSILITAEDLNRHKNLLCVQNGVIDLQTGKLYPLDAKYLITNQINAVFDPKADTSFVLKFFSDVLPDEDTRRAVLRYIGYGLTGEKTFHISQFWRGTGANGKSTILDLLTKIFGTYAVKLPPNSMIESNRPLDANAPSPALAMLDGDIRLAILDEIPRNCRLDGSIFKTITGDEFITARNLYSSLRKIQLRAKLILNGNHLPNFDADDGGIERRINNVEFTQKFSGDRADPDLPQKLSTPENRSAFLKLLVDEAQIWYREGLIESNAMKEAKQEYFAENDFVSTFVEENCIIGDGGEIPRKTFEEKIVAAFPAETKRIKKKDLFRIISEKLESLGAYYMKDNHNKNIFRNIRWQETD